MIGKTRGSILITTLWIMAILSLLAMGIGFRVSLEVRLSRYTMDKLQATYLAKAGIEKAKEYLRKDTERFNKYDTLDNCGIWTDLGETTESIFSAENNKLTASGVTVGSFSVYYGFEKEEAQGLRYGMLDEERKINIQLSKYKSVQDYKDILQRLSPDLEEDVINAIIDWQDSDSESLPGGAESMHYGNLDRPYKCKNSDFELIEELLVVKGVTRDLFSAIKDYITVYGEGKINVNTASRRVLYAVIGDGHADLIERIIEYRKRELGWPDMQSLFNSVQPTLNERNILEEYFVFESDDFRIISHGKASRVNRVITCVVGRGNIAEPGALKYYHEE